MDAKSEELITMNSTSSLPWKLYQNPHYSPSSLHNSSLLLPHFETIETPLHPSDDRAISEINDLRAKINDLRSELEFERSLRREAQSLTESLFLDLEEERRLRAEAEEDAARCREEADLAVEETEEDRRMLKYADAWREERVQMKLADAAIELEEKLREIKESVAGRSGEIDFKGRQGKDNPLFKKGIKAGIVEFQRIAVRVPSPGSGREKERVAGDLECRKSQLRAVLKQRNSTAHLVVVPDAQSLIVR